MARINFGLVLAILGGCGGGPTAYLESGDFYVQQAMGVDEDVLFDEVMLTLDVEDGEASFLIGDDEISFALLTRDEADWGVGCPMNYASWAMEIADIDASKVEIGELSIEEPIIVAGCGGGQGSEVVLRANGDVASGGGPCIGADVCVVFTSRLFGM
ncbi:MAG: hypothetical protein HN348_08860 [Proteobacteria bacterium]|jgi:hypothetical protein|nr:hypothetical protein [Pseudomonadota bacterium]